jgi:hypothetical protein
MRQILLSAIGDLASWLQSASQAVPISQLSLIAWVMLNISSRFDPLNPFNVPEQSTGSLSKASFQ